MSLQKLIEVINKKTEQEIRKINLEYEKKLKDLEKTYQKIIQERKKKLEEAIEKQMQDFFEKEKQKLEQRIELELDNFIFQLLPELKTEIVNYYRSLPEDEQVKWYKEKLALVFKKYGFKPIGFKIPKSSSKILAKILPKDLLRKTKINEDAQIKFGLQIIYQDLEVDLNLESLCQAILTKKLIDLKKLLV